MIATQQQTHRLIDNLSTPSLGAELRSLVTGASRATRKYGNSGGPNINTKRSIIARVNILATKMGTGNVKSMSTRWSASGACYAPGYGCIGGYLKNACLAAWASLSVFTICGKAVT